MRKLSAQNGYSEPVLGQALVKSYPKAERIIAAALGEHPATIWPSRYNVDGSDSRPPREGPGRPRVRPILVSSETAVNGNDEAAI